MRINHNDRRTIVETPHAYAIDRSGCKIGDDLTFLIPSSPSSYYPLSITDTITP